MPSRNSWVFALLCAETAALFAFAIVTLGHQQFGGQDQGALVDVAYRLYCGQHPYIDFPITQPILFYLGALWAVQIFDLTWSAFIYMTALFSAVTFALHLLLLRRIGISRVWSLSLAAVVQIGALIAGSFWWYNFISAVAVCLLCTASLLVLAKPEKLFHWFLYAGCLFMASLAKPNVAGLMILTSSAAILGCGRTRWRGLVFSLLAACASLALLGFYRINPLAVVHGYLSASGRGIPTLGRFGQDAPVEVIVWNVILVLLTFLPLAIFFRPGGGTSRGLPTWASLPLLGGTLAGLIGCFTNGEFKVVDLTMPLTAIGLLFLTRPMEDPRRRTALFFQEAAMIAVAATALWVGVTRQRIEAIGTDFFYQDTALYPVGRTNPFFAQLECGFRLSALLEQTEQILAKARRDLGREPIVFFGPRLGWGYAAFHLQAPLHLPYSWAAGIDFPESDAAALESAFKDTKFDLCFFVYFHGDEDTGYMSADLIKYLREAYDPVLRTQLLVVGRRKPGA